jgi:hypothetical protein
VEQFIGDGKDFLADLRAKIRASSDSFAQPEVSAALPGLLADLHEAPAVRARITESLERPVRDHFARAMRAAVERGDLAPSLDSDALFDLWAGALLYRVVLRRQSDQGFADQISDLLAAAASPDKGRRRNQPRSEIRPRQLQKKQRPDGHR